MSATTIVAQTIAIFPRAAASKEPPIKSQTAQDDRASPEADLRIGRLKIGHDLRPQNDVLLGTSVVVCCPKRARCQPKATATNRHYHSEEKWREVRPHQLA